MTGNEDRRRYARNLQSEREAAVLYRIMAEREEHPELARWLDSQKSHLDTIVEASERPRWYEPLVTGAVPTGNSRLVAGMPDVLSYRHATRVLLSRAMRGVGEGDVDAANGSAEVTAPEWAQLAAPTYLNYRKVSIYGGSSEVQRQIIDKAVLGL